MELRQYLSIFQRRWPIIVLTTAVALLASIIFAARGPRAYEATVRLAVSLGGDPTSVSGLVPPPGSPGANDLPPYLYFKDYYYWLAAEYLADDLSEIIRSDSFLADVGTTLNEDVRRVLVRDVVRTRKTHRIIEVTVLAPEPAQAEQIAAGINRVVQEHGGKYLAQLATPAGHIAVLDKPSAHPATTTGNQIIDILLRALAGFVIGVFLAVAADYLDSTIRTAQDVERSLGLPVVGQIPSSSR